jgi:hypothetical protein
VLSIACKRKLSSGGLMVRWPIQTVGKQERRVGTVEQGGCSGL